MKSSNHVGPENKNLKIIDLQYYENAANPFQKAFLALQSNCALCATNLELTVHSVNTEEIKEEAFCPQCELKLRSKNHRIH